MNKRIVLVLLATVLCLSTLWCAADTRIPSPNDDFYYYDEINAFSVAAKAEIFKNNEALSNACGAQIVVMAVKSLNNLTATEYAYRVINEWEVGDKNKQNGIVLLLAPNDDDYFLSQGVGTERFLSVDYIDKLLYQYLEPDFAKGDYEAGALKVFRQLFNLFTSQYRLNLTYQSDFPDNFYENIDSNANNVKNVNSEQSGGNKTFSTFTIIMLVIVVIVVISVSRTRYRARGSLQKPFIGPPRPPVPIPPRPPRPPRPIRSGFGHLGHFGGFKGVGGNKQSSSSRGGFGGFGGFGGGRSSGSGRSSGGSFGGFGGAKGGGGGGRGSGAGRRR